MNKRQTMEPLVVYDKANPTKIMLKQRHDRPRTNIHLRYGSLGIATQRTIRFEFTYLLYFRKFIKHLLRKKKRYKSARRA